MIDVLVSENIVGPALAELSRQFQVQVEPELWRDPQALAAAVADARALVVRNQTQVTAELIGTGQHLEVIGRAGAGLDNIDLEAASRSGVVVTYAPHENAVSVAEFTVGLMLALARRIPAADRHVRQGGWDRLYFTGTELCGKTVGIVGFGHIGTLVAERVRAFGVRVLACDPLLEADDPRLAALGATQAGFDEVLAAADIITCHVPLVPETRGLFSREQFRRMKPGVLLINTSRGEVIDESALIFALKEGHLAGAALDVRQQEPPPAGPLASMDNVILTPHIAAFTREAQQRVVETVCRDVAAVLRGDRAVRSANFPRPQRAQK